MVLRVGFYKYRCEKKFSRKARRISNSNSWRYCVSVQRGCLRLSGHKLCECQAKETIPSGAVLYQNLSSCDISL